MPLLLKSQKAELYALLQQQEGVNPADFEFVSTPPNPPWHDEGGDEIRLRGTGYHFTVYRNQSTQSGAGRFYIEFSPGKQHIHEQGECLDWQVVLHRFARYLSYLLREVNAIDPWESAKQFSIAVHVLPNTTTPNAPITGAEIEEIQNTLNNIQATLLKHVGNSSVKQQYIEEQFSLLRDSITKFGRKDYLMLLYTTVIGMATTIGVPPDVGSQIVGILNGLLTHIPKLLAS